MRKTVALLIPLAISFVGLALAQAQSGQKAKASIAVKSKTAAQAGTTSATAKPVNKEIDPDAAYKSNCTRCHVAPRKFSERETATIVRHMRVRANLTEEEEAAIIRYLTR